MLAATPASWEIVINPFYPQEADMHNASVAKCSVQMAKAVASVVGINHHLNPLVSLECIKKWAFEAYKSPARLVPKYDLS